MEKVIIEFLTNNFRVMSIQKMSKFLKKIKDYSPEPEITFKQCSDIVSEHCLI